MGHVWDDVVCKISQIMAARNSWKYRYWEHEITHEKLLTYQEISGMTLFDAPDQSGACKDT